MHRTLVAAIFFALVSNCAFAQATIYADPGMDPDFGSGGGSGTANDPFESLQAAIEAAASGDQIVIISTSFQESVIIEAKQLELTAQPGGSVQWLPEPGVPAVRLMGFASVDISRVDLRSSGVAPAGPVALIELTPGSTCELCDSSMEVNDGGWRWLTNEQGFFIASNCLLISSATTAGCNGLAVNGGFCMVEGSTIEADSSGAPATVLGANEADVILFGCTYEAIEIAEPHHWGNPISNASVVSDRAHLLFWGTQFTSHSTCGRLLHCVEGSLAATACGFEQTVPGCLGTRSNCLMTSGTDLDVASCSFSDWRNGEFLALGIFDGSGSVSDCQFSNCDSYDYGSPIRFTGSAIEVKGCVFTGIGTYVSSQDGSLHPSTLGLGAVAAHNVLFDDCVFDACGGAEYGALQLSGTSSVRGCEFQDCVTYSENYCHSGFGGAIRSDDTLVVEDSIFVRNRSGGPDCGGSYGGRGASIYAPLASVRGCTFIENECFVQVWYGGQAGETVFAETIESCLFVGEIPYATDVATDVSYSLNSGQVGLGNLTGTPRFVDAAAGDYRLLPCSVGIDAGAPSCLDEFSTVCEMGAFSFDPAEDAQVEMVCVGSPAAVCATQLSIMGCASLGDAGVEVRVDQLEPGAFGMLLIGRPEAHAAPYASLLCVDQPLLQFEPGVAGGTGACGGARTFSLDPALLGILGIGPGDSLVLSYVARRAGNPGALEVSNGVQVGPLR